MEKRQAIVKKGSKKTCPDLQGTGPDIDWGQVRLPKWKKKRGASRHLRGGGGSMEWKKKGFTNESCSQLGGGWWGM